MNLANDGQVDSVTLEDSTLDDQDLEDCMAGALRSLSADNLPMIRVDCDVGQIHVEWTVDNFHLKGGRHG